MAITIAQLTLPAKPHKAPEEARPAAHLTIRRKILLAFLCLSVVTASLGAYAIRSVVALGSLSDAAVADWRAAVAEPAEGGLADALSLIANRRLERPVDHTASDGLAYQLRARAEVVDAKFQMLLWICATTVLGGMIVTVLARRITGLIAGLSAVLCRIVAGHADTNLPSVGADELGAMLTTIRTMQTNIVAMTALEAAARHSKGPVPAAAAEKSARGLTGRKSATAVNAPSAAHSVRSMT